MAQHVGILIEELQKDTAAEPVIMSKIVEEGLITHHSILVCSECAQILPHR